LSENLAALFAGLNDSLRRSEGDYINPSDLARAATGGIEILAKLQAFFL